jgi:hypothetical protein
MCNECVACVDDAANGGWSSYETILDCKSNCEEGDVKLQKRECNNPVPQGGGRACDGDSLKATPCKGCSNSADSSGELKDQIDALEAKIGNINSNNGGGSPTSNSEGYRVFFRSSSRELSWTEIDALYRYGTTFNSAFPNNQGVSSSQFRDNNFFWYYEDVTAINLDIFDVNGDKFSTVTFDFGGEHPNLFEFFDDKYVSRSDYWEDIEKDVSTAGFSYFEHGRAFALAKNYGGCAIDTVWFAGLTKESVACDWDKRWSLSQRSVNDHVVWVYSPLNPAGPAVTRLDAASKMEFSMKGPDFGLANNGYERVFRYGSTAGVNVMDYLESGTTDSSQDRSTAFNGNVMLNELYRKSSIESDISGADRVLLVVYSQEGIVAEALSFKGAGDLKGWMSKANLVSTLFWTIDQTNFFGVDTEDYWGRYFYINRSYGGCNGDAGWLTVNCGRYNGDFACTEWDNLYSGNNADGNHQICAIMYSSTQSHHAWVDRNNIRFGSAIEIFVK